MPPAPESLACVRGAFTRWSSGSNVGIKYNPSARHTRSQHG